ncbi:hypothetical protein K474DRAFT_1609863, partial [Panus rudis PR-1116 ss-1]
MASARKANAQAPVTQKQKTTLALPQATSVISSDSVSIQPWQDVDFVRRCLRTLLQDNKADFKSEAQLEMLRYVLSASESIIVVLPTGGGKSTSFMVPAICEPQITIVLTPFISLMKDMMRKAEERGIPYAKWTASTHRQLDQLFRYRLLFVAYDSAASSEFTRFIRSHPGSFSRIIVDESHELMTARHYRERFEKLPL